MKKVKINAKITVILIIAVLLTYSTTTVLLPYISSVGAETYSWGSKGDVVEEIQKRLKAWGYYTGSVDGIYGYYTYKAVKYFQSKNGLSSDGIVGEKTLAAIGISSNTKKTSTNQDVELLAKLINGEARGEPYEGQVAVGAVVLNRTRDPRFPSTVAGVIYQPGAFTAIVDGQINAKIEQNSINAARDAINGWDPSGGALYYFNPAKATSTWIWSRPLIKIIGKHRFCK
ncbi:MAG: spore cortex-lytic enzyme [Clostridiaceae bacterium]